MKNKSQTIRAVTEPISNKFYEKSIKIQGIVYIEQSNQKNKKTTIIDVKPNCKILFHCYKRYKTFSYTMDHIYQEGQNEQFYGGSFSKQNAVNAINLGLNYMMFCVGVGVKSSTELPYVGNVFYHQLSAVYERFIHDESHSWTINALAITDDTIYDLASDRKTVQLRQIIPNKNPSLSQIYLIDCYSSQPETTYQIFQLIKQSWVKKHKQYPKSYFGLYCEVSSNKNQQKTRLLFVDTTKQLGNNDKNWDNASCLVLNKCILGLQNKLDSNKESYAPFRDCRLTRMMKPFLTADSKVDAVGFVSATDEETPFSTLNLIKSLSRLKVPILKNIQNESTTIQNPETTELRNKTYELRNLNQKSRIIQQTYSPDHRRKISNPRTQKSEEQRPDLFEQIRRNAKEEHQEQKKLNKIRVNLKMMKKKKQISLSRILLEDKSKALQDQLQEQQYEFAIKKELEIINKIDETNKNRIAAIEKSISKVQKLKLLREYYTMALLNQKEQAAQFQKSQLLLGKFYQERLNCIDKSLKKSPKQLLGYEQEDTIQPSPRNKRYQSNDKNEKHSLPSIASKRNKRVVYIKQKVKKGRVEYQQFLSKNVSQYKSYLSSSPQS